MYKSYPFETLSIAKAITSSLQSVPQPTGIGSFAVWTSCIKEGIYQLAQGDLRCAYAAREREICLDATVWRGTNLVLGVESEWSNNVIEIERDFLKLLGCSNSPQKLMITDSGKHCFQRFSEKLLQMLRGHEHISGTQYLWFDIHGDTVGGGWIDAFEWTATEDGLQEVPHDWPHAGHVPFRFLSA